MITQWLLAYMRKLCAEREQALSRIHAAILFKGQLSACEDKDHYMPPTPFDTGHWQQVY